MSPGPKPWLQQNWDARAAANFILGGTGSGLLIAGALAASPLQAPVILIALGLIAAGLGAVWHETGRKLRAANVLFNPMTSWMTRESYAAIAVFALGIGAIAMAQPWLDGAAALAALAFVWCQGRILHGAKGIPAWRAPEVVPLVVATALAEGAGLYLLFDRGGFAVTLLALALIARALAWMRYRAVLHRMDGQAALEPAGNALLWLGTVAALALAAAAYFVPQAAWLAALAAVGAGWWLKFALVTRAAFNQGFALPRLPVRGVR